MESFARATSPPPRANSCAQLADNPLPALGRRCPPPRAIRANDGHRPSPARAGKPSPEAAAVRAFVASGAWRDAAAFRRIPTRNPRYEVYAFDLPGAGTPCILKIAQAAPAGHRGARRLEALVSHLAHDPARRALRRPRLLEQHGLPTFRPLACWTARRGGRFRDSFFLYAKTPPAIRSGLQARHYRSRNPVETPAPSMRSSPAGPSSSPPASPRLAPLRSRLRQFPGWTPKAGARSTSTTSLAARSRRPAWLKRCFDLNTCACLDLDDARLDAFLRRYLGADDSPGWRRVFASGARRTAPFRWLRRRLAWPACPRARSSGSVA
jgi:hypothetical protein